MLYLLSKNGPDYEILELPAGDAEIGTFLALKDPHSRRTLVLQIVDITYLKFPGEIEEIIRMTKASDMLVESRADDIFERLQDEIMDSKLLRCKVRGGIHNGAFSTNTLWAPSRMKSFIYEISFEDLRSSLHLDTLIPVSLGRALRTKVPLVSDLADVDGALTLILGRKGVGKSMLAKSIVKSLAANGAKCLILDVNNEYMVRPASKEFVVWEPGVNLRFEFRNLPKEIFLSLLGDLMELPASSILEISRTWDKLESSGRLSFSEMKREILSSRINDLVKDALLRRLDVIYNSGIITDDPIYLDPIIELNQKEGLCISLALRGRPSLLRKLIIELLMKKIIAALEKDEVRPFFLFAEEAHTYQNMNFWEDLVTRMRHLGLSIFFVTNEPNSLSNFIYRQADSLFIFNYFNDNDLVFLSKVSDLDTESLLSYVRGLPDRCCLAMGRITSNLPLLFETYPDTTFSGGRTKTFFAKHVLQTMKSSPCRRSCLDLARRLSNSDVGYIIVLRFTRPVAYHDSISALKCQQHGLKGLCERAYLIHLEQERIRYSFGYARLQSLLVRHENIVTDYLNARMLSREGREIVRIVFREWVLY